MAFAIVSFLVLAAMCALPAIFGWYDDATKKPHVGTEVKEPAGTGPTLPESLEGVLVAQLAAEEITRPQYLRAMAGLAARDDERHPLTLPPESGAADV